MDTERGLIVPVIRDVDRKSLIDLAAELGEKIQRTREGKISLDELRGGTFTLTNAGAIGGHAFIPIINYPERPSLASDGRSPNRWCAMVRSWCERCCLCP